MRLSAWAQRIVAKPRIAAVLRSRNVSKTRGFMKALVAEHSDRVLGFTMFGPEAGEVMAAVQTARLAYPTLPCVMPLSPIRPWGRACCAVLERRQSGPAEEP